MDKRSLSSDTSFKKVYLLPSCFLAFLIIILFLPVINPMKGIGDYADHARFAEEMMSLGHPTLPHFLFHLLVIGLYLFIPHLSFFNAGLVVVIISYISLSIILYGLIRPSFGDSESVLVSLMASLISLSLMLVSPVSLYTWSSHNLYFGYIGINTLHNPTLILLKPIALMLFVFTVRFFFYASPPISLRKISLIILLTVLSTLAKPNFTISFLPALLLFSFFRYKRGYEVKGKWLVMAIFVPGFLLIAWQYFFTYYFSTMDPSHIIWAPFKVKSYFSSLLFPKFFLSILFPMCLYLGYFSEAKKSLELNLAWLTFLMGAFYCYFLAESGKRMYAGNFIWSAQITLFVLFVVSTLFFIRYNQKLFSRNESILTKGFAICLLTFVLHLVSGIFFYYIHLHPPISAWL